MSVLLTELEKWTFAALQRHADVIPSRWQRWLAMYFPDARIRKLFWQKTFVELGEGSYASLGMVVLDDRTAEECLLSIGDRVSIGANVVFVAYSLPNNSPAMQAHPYIAEKLIRREKIVVEDDAWIGAQVTIFPGVRIGGGAIVGAGSVVLHDVPASTIVAGVPARVIRELEALVKEEK